MKLSAIVEKKGNKMKKILALALTLTMALCIIGCGSSSGATFSMSSNDTTGANKHTVVGMDNVEPSGTYQVTCTSGHGSITINDQDLHFLASDEYAGQEQSGMTFEESATLELKGNDVILARNFNSSDFKIEFTLQ